MKIKQAILKQPLTVGSMGLAGAFSLSLQGNNAVQALEVENGFMRVTRNDVVALIPLSNVSYLIEA